MHSRKVIQRQRRRSGIGPAGHRPLGPWVGSAHPDRQEIGIDQPESSTVSEVGRRVTLAGPAPLRPAS
jgi:hypothetical protein